MQNRRGVSTLVGLAVSLLVPAFAPPSLSAAVGAPCPADVHPIGVRSEWSPLHPCVDDEVKLSFMTCGPCDSLLGADLVAPDLVRVRARARGGPCITLCLENTVSLSLGRLPAGRNRFVVEVEREITWPEGNACTTVHKDTLTIPVAAICPAPPEPLPYVDEVRIGPAPPDSICAGQPIAVSLKGTFPNDCLYLKDVQVLDLWATPLPRPAIVRVIVATNSCLLRPCMLGPVPWSATVRIPGLPPGAFELPLQVQLVDVNCAGQGVPGDLWASTVPFRVGEPCAPPSPGDCFLADWDHSAHPGGPCDGTIGADHAASVTLTISTPIALAGLQGEIGLQPAGLHIQALTPVGPAAGMHIQWTPMPGGAKFVMFALEGAPIPPKPDDVLLAPVPVLEVTAAETPGAPTPPLTSVFAINLLGSDTKGGSVIECPSLWVGPNRFMMPRATICAGLPAACDFNGDGRSNVLDLVLMVHCVLQSGYCPPDASGHLDCDEDGQVTIDDVLCCAHSMLRGDTPPGVPGRPEPGVGVSFGVPSRSPIGLDLPLRVSGVDRIGAARLALRFPDDRYDVSWVDGPWNAGSWLSLHEVSGDQLVLGLIGVQPNAPSNALDMVVHFALKPGRAPGGAIQVESGEFAGPDGTTLEVRLDQPPLRLDGPTGLALSAGEPNPFARAMSFTVSLTRPAEVDVAIHDPGGRLVTVLHHGALGPGAHPFTWDGSRADGSAAPNGLYFYRVRAGGEAATRKVVLLRGR